jgi:hypothetical protein
MLLGLKWTAILKWQAIVEHKLPHLLHFFTLGKWVQLKHKLNTAVTFSKGIATIVYKMSVCYLKPCVIKKNFQLLR